MQNERVSANCVTCSSPPPSHSAASFARSVEHDYSAGSRRLARTAGTTPSYAERCSPCEHSPTGAAPIPASSGQTLRYRLDRSGDRQLNRALHQIILTRRRIHPPTVDYIERRVREGKSRREATRCLKRYLARKLYRLLEHPPATA